MISPCDPCAYLATPRLTRNYSVRDLIEIDELMVPKPQDDE